MDKVGSVEFGDWLIHELMKQKLLSMPKSESALKAKNARVTALKGGEKLLLEFLSHQEVMMGRPTG
jgi:hypothetical protein